jgi:2,4-dienoyl-CoA reductase-like NADH-dependent reductase (Old Yellow Enzyme family)/NADPH-dependent 2,4-dienoyl-CoA reductase/sulfur reductase-like enzyme
MPSYPALFSPLAIGGVEVKNRIVMPAMATNVTTDGTASQRLIDYFVERARGGTGLIITEAASVLVPPDGKFARFHLNISDDRFIPPLKRLTDAVHAHGTKIAVQLSHLGRQITTEFWGEQPAAPSPIACPVCRDLPRELTVNEITLIVHAFAQAARRAHEAGFDMVELHGCHGYLISNFFSRRSNHRSDMYGGDAVGRSRFCVEIIRAIKDLPTPPIPVIVRMNGHDYIRQGAEPDDMRAIAPLLEEAGADALHVTAGVYGSYPATVAPMYENEGCFVHLAEGIRKVVSIPVIAVGRITTPVMAEDVIQNSRADLVAMGRALIADPELPAKALSSDSENICPCTGCNQGCIDRINDSMMAGRTQPVTCLVNPRVLREGEWTVAKAEKRKQVVVLGGGPAGLAAALAAVRRGHDVALWERENTLGGQLRLAGAPPGRESFMTYIRYMERQVTGAGVHVVFGKEATADALADISPDTVIYALGASPVIPAFARESAVTTTAWDVLRGSIPGGRRIAVIGGGAVGLETAHFLSAREKDVTVLEATGLLGSDMGAIVSFYLRNILKQAGVNIIRHAAVLALDDGDITVIREGNEERLGGFDAVVLALGAHSNDALAGELKKAIPDLHIIGDARRPRKALEAIAEGFEAGTSL